MKRPERHETRPGKIIFSEESVRQHSIGYNVSYDAWEEYHDMMMAAKDGVIAFNKQTEKDVQRAELENDKLRRKIYELKLEIIKKDKTIKEQMDDIVEYRNEAMDKGV